MAKVLLNTYSKIAGVTMKNDHNQDIQNVWKNIYQGWSRNY